MKKSRKWTQTLSLVLGAMLLFAVPGCGKKEVTAIAIKPEAVDPEDVEMLQDLVLSAVNEALRQADEAMEQSMGAVTGGLNLGSFGL